MLSQPAEGFAAETLDRLYRKVRKQGRNLDSLSDDERHALRMVARGGADDAAARCALRQARDAVVGATQLEREDRLQVLALEPDLIADAT